MKQKDFLIRVDKNGTKYWGNNTCQRCGGQGEADQWRHTGLVCYECGGSGVSRTRVWKEYTPEYAAKLEARRKKKFDAQMEKRRAEADKLNAEYYSAHGYTPDGRTWVVLGNTYKQRMELPLLGCVFSIIGWHIDHPIDRPTLEMNASDTLLYDAAGVVSGENEDALSIVREANKALAAKDSPSEYVGNIGDRIEIPVELVGRYSFETHLGGWGRTELRHIYTMKDAAGNVFVWKTGVYINPDESNTFTIRGTVKDHSEYKGIKQTVLTRCNILE